MARGTLTIYTSAITGTPVTYVAADAVNGHEYANTGKEVLSVRNDDVSDTTVTIGVNQTVDSDLVVPDRTVVVTAGTEEDLGPYSKATYSTAGGKVEIDVSNDTSVTLCVRLKGV